ncbi:MAG: hypothetical protein AAGJ35_00945 [Myxococcota bacterium]
METAKQYNAEKQMHGYLDQQLPPEVHADFLQQIQENPSLRAETEFYQKMKYHIRECPRDLPSLALLRNIRQAIKPQPAPIRSLFWQVATVCTLACALTTAIFFVKHRHTLSLNPTTIASRALPEALPPLPIDRTPQAVRTYTPASSSSTPISPANDSSAPYAPTRNITMPYTSASDAPMTPNPSAEDPGTTNNAHTPLFFKRCRTRPHTPCRKWITPPHAKACPPAPQP